MISTHPTYRVGLERVDDLRREAETWRRVKLARAEPNPSPSTTRPAQSLQPKHDQAAHTLAVAARARGEIRRVALTLVPGRGQP
jgi:hypothetical protein